MDEHTILTKVTVTPMGYATECWLWKMKLTADGYGPHRDIYIALGGRVRKGLHLDHLCNIRACVRPDHLEPVTPAVNQQRMLARGRLKRGANHHNGCKDTCLRGHLLMPDNVYVTHNPNGRTERACKMCYRLVFSKNKKRVERAPQNGSKTKCIRGHPFSGENLIVSMWRGVPKRICRACKCLRQKKYRQQQWVIALREGYWRVDDR